MEFLGAFWCKWYFWLLEDIPIMMGFEILMTDIVTDSFAQLFIQVIGIRQDTIEIEYECFHTG